MSAPSAAKRRCASVRLVTNTTNKHAPVVNDVSTPVRCSTASPKVYSSSVSMFDSPAVSERFSEQRRKDDSESPSTTPTLDVNAANATSPPKPTISHEQRISELEKELQLVEAGTHPKFLEKLREFQQKQADELEMIDIMYEREKEAIERKYLMEHAAIQRELKEREDELVQTLLLELDDRIRFIEAEVAVLDVAGPACPTFSMNKKCLRRRPHDNPTPVEKKKARAAAPPIIHLLPEHIIAEDVRLLVPPESIPSVVQHHKVSLDNGKLIYEGKTYQRGQALVVQTENYGAFAGMILSICEQYIQFRSTVPGDTRQVMATMDDLESGRVILRKKII
ncbi:Sds3 domain containing protein [Trichostrongylus colubriformis]|uniref:Sds3 domain containing protein n=1 Tax=Trichostrongylus colubriformis TaxID=6319 RepID=A0AAN8FE99_TRICO